MLLLVVCYWYSVIGLHGVKQECIIIDRLYTVIALSGKRVINIDIMLINMMITKMTFKKKIETNILNVRRNKKEVQQEKYWFNGKPSLCLSIWRKRKKDRTKQTSIDESEPSDVGRKLFLGRAWLKEAHGPYCSSPQQLQFISRNSVIILIHAGQ